MIAIQFRLTSAGQFAGITLMASAATVVEIAVTQLIINSRYFLMSFALSQKIDPNTPFFHRLIMAYGITDEVFGVSIAVPGKLSPYYAYGVMSVAVPGWAPRHTVWGYIWKYSATKIDERLKYCVVRNATRCHYPSSKREQNPFWIDYSFCLPRSKPSTRRPIGLFFGFCSRAFFVLSEEFY